MSEDTKEPIEAQETEEPTGILGVFASKKAKDAQRVVSLTEQVASLDSENVILHEEVAKLQSVEKKLIEQLETLQSDLDAGASEIEELKELVEKADNSAGQKAAQIAAQNHVSAEDLPAASSSESSDIPSNEAALEEALQGCESHAERSALVKQFRNRSNN